LELSASDRGKTTEKTPQATQEQAPWPTCQPNKERRSHQQPRTVEITVSHHDSKRLYGRKGSSSCRFATCSANLLKLPVDAGPETSAFQSQLPYLDCGRGAMFDRRNQDFGVQLQFFSDEPLEMHSERRDSQPRDRDIDYWLTLRTNAYLSLHEQWRGSSEKN